MMRRLTLPLIAGTLAGTAFVGGFCSRDVSLAASSAAAGLLEPQRTYVQALSRLKTTFAGALPGEKTGEADRQLTYSAISGLLGALEDPYTAFLDPKAWTAMREETQGSFVGIGAQLDPRVTKEGYQLIRRPMAGAPAERAGLKAGDIITHVDGKSTKGQDVDAVVARIRGKEGTSVEITVRRKATPRPITVTIVRKMVDFPNITAGMKGDYGYITLTQFADSTDELLAKAMADLSRKGAKGFIIDLRENPGGLLESAQAVASRFLRPGETVVLVQERGRPREKYEAFQTRGPRVNKPIVVLVNSGSASASEIVAGALKDHGVATIVGTRTFGKGLVQIVIPLADGSAVRITQAKYFTPTGHDINRYPGTSRGGIEPDIVATVTQEDFQNHRDPQLDRAIEELNRKVYGRATAAQTPASGPRP
jgi:carboxyl-terminal processing protease